MSAATSVLPKPSPNIVRLAFGGPMCSGKTFIVDHLKAQYAHCATVKFSTALYRICTILGMTDKDRAMLQDVGKALTGHYKPTCFIDGALREITQLEQMMEMKGEGGIIVVEDIRNPLELEALQQRGFYTVFLDVPEFVRRERLKKTYPDNFHEHLSRWNHETENVKGFADKFHLRLCGLVRPSFLHVLVENALFNTSSKTITFVETPHDVEHPYFVTETFHMPVPALEEIDVDTGVEVASL